MVALNAVELIVLATAAVLAGLVVALLVALGVRHLRGSGRAERLRHPASAAGGVGKGRR
ncbi:MAG: hypothetical protein ACRCSN_11205 [Dermatophilaceae bacterium]